MNRQNAIHLLDKIIYTGVILLAAVLLLPISFISTVWTFLLLAWIIKIILIKGENFKISSLGIPIFIFMGVTFLSVVFSVDFLRSFKGLKREFLVLIFFLIINSVKDTEHIKKMIKWFFIGLLIVSLFGIFQYILGIKYSHGGIDVPFRILSYLPDEVLKFLSLYDQRVTGSRDHPISFAEGLIMGGILMVSLVLFSNNDKKKKIYLGFGTLIVGICVMLTYSRGAWLGGMAGLVFIEIFGFNKFFPSSKLKKILLPATLIGLVLIVFIAGLISSVIGGKYSVFNRAKNFVDSERICMWKSGWKMVCDYPLSGIGLKNVSLVYPRYKRAEATHKNEGHLHNNFIQICVERGIPGLAAFMVLLGIFFKEGFRIYKKISIAKRYEKAVVLGCLGGVVSFIVSGLTEYNYGDWEVLALFWFIMGIMVVIGDKERNTVTALPLVAEKRKGDKKMAVFLDRDGTINEEVGYINHPDRYNLLPRVAKAIRLLNKKRITTIVATNQAGVARGYFKEEMVGIVHQKMQRLLAGEGAYVDAIYYCPHHPAIGGMSYRKDCDCRKPGVGMLEKGKKHFNVDLKQSFVVGDKFSDVKWGHKVGAKSIMVLTGYGKGEYEYQSKTWDEQPDYIARDLYEAVQWIIKKVKYSG